MGEAVRRASPSGGRQNVDPCAAARQRIRPQDPAVLHDQLAREVQSDADPGFLFSKGRLAGGEGLVEGTARDRPCQPGPLIGDRDKDALIGMAGTNLDLAAGRRVAAGVVQQLAHDVSEARGIAQHPEPTAHARPDRDLGIPAGRFLGGPVDERPQVHLGLAEREVAAFDLRDGDDLVDERHQLVEGDLQLAQEVGALLVADARVAEHVGDALGDGGRRSELVGHVRQELRLGRDVGRRLLANPHDLRLDLVKT